MNKKIFYSYFNMNVNYSYIYTKDIHMNKIIKIKMFLMTVS